MTSKKTTRRALFSSVISLILCCAMLIGTTFAWFTDNVTSGINQIVAGNLDVELEYLVGDTWTKVTESTNMFEENTLWEPGHTEVIYLKVSNLGTLALKYQLGVNIVSETGSINVYDTPFKLSDFIEFGVIEGVATPYANRDLARAAVTESSIISAGYSKSSKLEKQGDAEYVALVVYMPELVDNNANYKTGSDVPEIKLGVNLLATQLTYEEDSFDDQYDAAAPWTGIIPNKIPESLVIEPTLGEQTGTITVNSPEALVYLNKLATEWVSLYSNGKGTEVTYYRESEGGKGTDYYYHWRWTIELAADLDMNNIPMDSVDISYWDNFEGNGHTISNVVLKDGQDGLFNNGAKAINNLTVKNIIVNAPQTETVGAVAGNGTMNNVHVVNATVNGGKYVGGICGKGSSFTNCSIKDSTVTGTDKTVGGLVGYSIGDPNPATVTGNTVENVTVTGAYNVGGLLGQSQNETVENNTVKNVSVISTTLLPTDASSNEVRTAEVAARSAFANTTIGTNTVENCETVELIYGLKVVPNKGAQTGTITVSSVEGLLNLNKLAVDWVGLFSNGKGTEVTYYRESEGGKGTDYYYHWRWTIELAADLDMNNIPMDSVDISYWDNFEGNGHTISNVVLKDGQDGLFNNGAKAINNLTVKNIIVNAPQAETVGAVAGNGTMNNVHVVNATVNGGKYVGGICGKGSSFTNCSIKDSTVTGTDKTVGGLVGYSIGDPNPATVTGNTVENVTVTGAYNVGGLLGQSQNETVENNTVKNVTVISTTALPANASSNEVRTAEVAARSAFANTTIVTNTVENVTKQEN